MRRESSGIWTRQWMLGFAGVSFVAGIAMMTSGFGLIKLSASMMLDSAFRLSASEVINAIEGLGAAGRQAHLYLHILDYVFLAGFYPFLASIANQVFQRYESRPLERLAVLLPIIAGLADLLENITVDILLATWPEATVALASAIPGLTIAKFLVLALSLLAIIIGYVASKVVTHR